MKGHYVTPLLFTDTNPSFSRCNFSHTPIDWKNLNANPVANLVDICNELVIPVKKPIIKTELISSIQTYLRTHESHPTLKLNPAYDHFNQQQSTNSSQPANQNRIPESYCQQLPSISSYFGTSSSYQPQVVSPFAQTLKDAKRSPSQSSLGEKGGLRIEMTENKKTRDFKPQPNDWTPTAQKGDTNIQAKDFVPKQQTSSATSPTTTAASANNNNNKFVYNNSNNNGNNYNNKKQNKNNNQQPNKMPINKPDPSQIMVNKQQIADQDKQKLINTPIPPSSISTNPNVIQKPPNFVPSKTNSSTNNNFAKTNQNKKQNNNNMQMPPKPETIAIADVEHPQKQPTLIISNEPKTEPPPVEETKKEEKEKVLSSEELRLQSQQKQLQIQLQIQQQAQQQTKDNKKNAKPNKVNRKSDNSKEDKKKDKKEEKLISEHEEKPKVKEPEPEPVYVEIVKEKKKKIVHPDLCGCSPQKQRFIFRVSFAVVHVILFVTFLVANDFSLSIPYRL